MFNDCFHIQTNFGEFVCLTEWFSKFLTLPFVTRSGMVGVWESCFSSELHAFDYLVCCSVSVVGCPSLCQIWVFSCKILSFVSLVSMKQRCLFILSWSPAVSLSWSDLERCWCLRTHSDFGDASLSTTQNSACGVMALLSLLRGARGKEPQLIDGCDQISPMNHLVAASCVSVLLFF